jgi:hypothetical protein
MTLADCIEGHVWSKRRTVPHSPGRDAAVCAAPDYSAAPFASKARGSLNQAVSILNPKTKIGRTKLE